MISHERYDQLVGKSHQPISLVQFFRESPLVGVELDLEREKTKGAISSYERVSSRTNCISELVRPSPHARVLAWMEAADESVLYLSVLTFGEIGKGMASMPQAGAERAWKLGLRQTPEAFPRQNLSDRRRGCGPLGIAFCRARRMEKPFVIDGLLAATAIQHNLTIVSRNVSDFADASVQLLNPWEA